jgi:hypothetical protein
MVGAVKHTFREIISEIKPKHLIVGASVLFITAWVFRRLLPGAALRMGLNPAPLAPSYQNTWPEPFGLQPILPAVLGAKPMTTRSMTSSGPTQEQLGQAIIAATQASLPSSSGDILASITSGNA